MANIKEANKEILKELELTAERLEKTRSEIGKVIFGQQEVVELALTAILAGGHALLVGAPGLAKTKLATSLGRVLGLGGVRPEQGHRDRRRADRGRHRGAAGVDERA